MPGVEENWTDKLGLMEAELLNPENESKLVTEYKLDDTGKKAKIIRTYKIESRIVTETIAARRNIPKFGDSANDKPGPNPATTLIGEDIFMQFASSFDDSKPEENELEALKTATSNIQFKCRSCQGEHLTVNCPLNKHPSNDSENKVSTSNKYIAPSLREGARRDPPNSMNSMRRDDLAAIRITNLSESTDLADLEDLVKLFGPVQKHYLAKDKHTGLCKGFAYVHFKYRSDATKAIQVLNGHGYDHQILSVDWSKPSNSQN